MCQRVAMWSSLLLGFLAVTAEESLIPDEVAQLIEQGTEKHDQQDYEGAVAAYRQALAISPNDRKANFELALSLMHLKRFDEALDQALTAASKPGAAGALLHDLAGTILDDQRRFKEGEKQFREALELDPNVPSIHFNLGINLAFQARWLDALEALRGAIERRPLHAPTWYAIAACLDHLEERSLAALSYWRYASLADDSNSAWKASERAWTLLNTGVSIDANGETVVQIDVDDGSQLDTAEFLAQIEVAARRTIEQRSDAEILIELLPSLAIVEPNAGTVTPGPASAAALGTTRSFFRRQLRFYFEEVERRKLMAALVHSVRAPFGEKATVEWLAEHDDEVEALRTLSRSWPPAPKPTEKPKSPEPPEVPQP